MWPVAFRIAGLEVGSFGVLVALGVLAGIGLFRSELARAALPIEAADAAVVAVVAGLGTGRS